MRRTAVMLCGVVILSLIGAIAFAEEPEELQSLVLNEDGLSVLSNDAKLTKEALEKLFVGLRVEEKTYSAEGDDYSVFVLYDGKKKVIELEPGAEGKVSRILVYGKQIAGPKGLHCGSTYEDLIEVGKVECQRGADETYSNAFCTVEGIEKPSFVFDLDAGKCLENEEVSPKCLARKVVEKMYWYH